MFTFTRLAAAALVAGAAVAGVTGPAFYVDGVMYRTVATPTDLSGTGAPAHAWDTIYSFGSAQPTFGDRGYNGGRWMVHALSFPNGYGAVIASSDLDHDGVIDSTAEVAAALMAGDAVDGGGVKCFVRAVIEFPAGR